MKKDEQKGCCLILASVIIILGLILGFWFCKRWCEAKIYDKVLHEHTTDTIRIYEPKVIYDTIIRYVTAKLPIKSPNDVTKSDTEDNFAIKEPYIPLPPRIEKVADSVCVEIPITQKVYEDSLYRAWVSGYNPHLDSLRLYVPRVYPPKQKRSRLHITAGVGAAYNGKLAPGVFIGVGVSLYEIKLN